MPSTAEYLQEFIERSSDPSVIHDIGVMLCKKISASAKITSRSIKGDTTTLVCLELQHVAWKRLRELSLESVQTEVKSESRAELEARLARLNDTGIRPKNVAHIAAVQDELRSRPGEAEPPVDATDPPGADGSPLKKPKVAAGMTIRPKIDLDGLIAEL